VLNNDMLMHHHRIIASAFYNFE